MTAADHLGDLLSALVDAELAPEDERAVRAHLLGCPTCAGELAVIRRVSTLIRRLPAVEPPVPLEPASAAPVVSRWVARLAAAAAAAALLVLAGVQVERPADPMGRLVRVHTTSAVNADPVSQVAPAAVPVSFEP